MPTVSPGGRALALLAALVLTGCGTVRGSSQAVGPDRLDAAAAELAGARGVLTLTDGRRVLVEGLRMDPDTTSWVDPRTGDLRLVATPFVAEVEARDRRGAILKTAGVGALVAAAAGAALGVALCADLGCGDETLTGALALGALAAPSGALWGGVIGAVADPVHRWTFEPAPAAPPPPAPPEGGR